MDDIIKFIPKEEGVTLPVGIRFLMMTDLNTRRAGRERRNNK